MAEIKVRIPSTISAEEYPPAIPAVIVAHKVTQEPYIINHGGETPFVENKDVQIETPKYRSWATCIRPRKSLMQKVWIYLLLSPNSLCSSFLTIKLWPIVVEFACHCIMV